MEVQHCGTVSWNSMMEQDGKVEQYGVKRCGSVRWNSGTVGRYSVEQCG